MEKPNVIEMPLCEADSALRLKIAAWYCDVFNDPAIFADSWTIESAADYLFGQSGQLEERLFVSSQSETVIGMAIAVVSSIDKSLTMRELPPEHRNSAALAGIRRQITWFVSEHSPVMVFREVGIHANFRGSIDLAMDLIVRPTAWAVECGAEFGCFWTSKKSPLYRLLKAYDIRNLYDFGGDRSLVFMGDDPRSSLRRLSSSAMTNRRLLKERLIHQGISR